MIKLVTFLLVFALVPELSAQSSICEVQNYESEITPDFDCPGPEEEGLIPDLNPPPSVPVEESREIVAEWEGALVHRDRLLQVGLTIKGLRRLRWADRLRLRREYDIYLEYVEETERIRRELVESQRDAFEERLVLSQQRTERAQAWWRSPALWFAIGFISAGAITALTAYALSAVN